MCLGPGDDYPRRALPCPCCKIGLATGVEMGFDEPPFPVVHGKRCDGLAETARVFLGERRFDAEETCRAEQPTAIGEQALGTVDRRKKALLNIDDQQRLARLR